MCNSFKKKKKKEKLRLMLQMKSFVPDTELHYSFILALLV